MAFVPPKSLRELPFKETAETKKGEVPVKVLPPSSSMDFDFYDFMIMAGGFLTWL